MIIISLTLMVDLSLLPDVGGLTATPAKSREMQSVGIKVTSHNGARAAWHCGSA